MPIYDVSVVERPILEHRLIVTAPSSDEAEDIALAFLQGTANDEAEFERIHKVVTDSIVLNCGADWEDPITVKEHTTNA